MGDEPRDHVIRENLPWRDEQLTECGRAANDVASTITREELRARVKKHGSQRTAFTVCMTCYNTVGHAPQWADNPTGVINRERGTSPIVYHKWEKDGNGSHAQTGPHVDQISIELHAIAELIAAHRDEYDQRVTAARDSALFTHRRQQADKKKPEYNNVQPIRPRDS